MFRRREKKSAGTGVDSMGVNILQPEHLYGPWESGRVNKITSGVQAVDTG
jgi:hypothetical protein